MVAITVTSDRRADARFVRLDKAAAYVRLLLQGGVKPEDIQAEEDGTELDIVEDLGVRFFS